jgi:hypothetical protein
LTLGFALTFGALFVKTYRIATVFNSNSLRQKFTLTNNRLLFYLAVIISAEMVLLVLFQAISPLGRETYPGLKENWDYYETCGSEGSVGFTVTLVLGNILLMLSAAYYAFRVRKVNDSFQESSYLFACIQNILIVVSVTAIIYFITYQLIFELRTFFLGVVVNFLVISTHGILGTSKINALREHDRLTRNSTFVTGGTVLLDGNSRKNPVQDVSSLVYERLLVEKQRLEEVVTALQNENRALRHADRYWSVGGDAGSPRLSTGNNNHGSNNNNNTRTSSHLSSSPLPKSSSILSVPLPESSSRDSIVDPQQSSAEQSS